MATIGGEDLNEIIAGNLRELRRERGLTLDEAAALTGVSKSMLGQIERGDCGLSVATLWKIANGLKLSFTSLMRETASTVQMVENTAPKPLSNGTEGFRLYPLFPFEPDRDFEVLYLELDSGAQSLSDPHEAGAEEYTMVQSGTLTLHLGEETYAVPAGHSIRYAADLPHGYENRETEQVRLSMVIRYRRR